MSYILYSNCTTPNEGLLSKKGKRGSANVGLFYSFLMVAFFIFQAATAGLAELIEIGRAGYGYVAGHSFMYLYILQWLAYW